MTSHTDPVEDLPFEEGVSESDWTGMAWRDIPSERVEYLIKQSKHDKGKIVKLLSQVEVGQGRKRTGVPDFKTAKRIQNSLYRGAQNAWGTKSANGKKVHSNIKIEITHDAATDTWEVEFVHLPPKKDEGVEQ